MRRKNKPQVEFILAPAEVSNETLAYYESYSELSMLLDDNPKILECVHRDIENGLKVEDTEDGQRKRGCRYTSENVLRSVIVQTREGLSLREACIRIDESCFLRHFVRIHQEPMMHSSLLCRLRNLIKADTWKEINRHLARYAVANELITGKKLRMDTTAVETNVHYPTDSSLLSDINRVLSRLIGRIRELFPEIVGQGRLGGKRIKRLADEISRKSAKKQASTESLKPLYERLIPQIERLCDWGDEILIGLKAIQASGRYDVTTQARCQFLSSELEQHLNHGRQVLSQVTRRVIDGEKVPCEEKLLSIFEPHTELLVRGKAGKRIEYGHMIEIEQVEEKFITNYEVFEKKPVEHQLIAPALLAHSELFGCLPDELSADKGYYESMTVIKELEKDIEVVSIGKKGKRNDEETEREHSFAFRLAQKFRAGIEGTISYLKRVFRLVRCFSKGWDHFQAAVGSTIFTHNLVLLTRW